MTLLLSINFIIFLTGVFIAFRKPQVLLFSINEMLLLLLWSISIYAIRVPLSLVELLSSLVISSTILIFFLYWYFRRIPNFINEAFANGYDRKVIKPGYFLLLIILVTFTLFGDILNPRSGYEVLVEKARDGSPLLTLLKSISMISLVLCYNFKNTFLVFIIFSFLGSKGVLIQPILVFVTYRMIRDGKLNNITILMLACFMLILYYVIENYTAGIKNIWSYYLNSYFDHTRNFQEISDLLPVIPNLEMVVPFINDYLPGLSRITGIYKVNFQAEYFPSDMSVGKSAGLMRYEKFYRLGIILIFIDVVFRIVYLEFFIKAAGFTKSKFLQRAIILVPSKRLIFIPVVLFVIIKLCLKKRN